MSESQNEQDCKLSATLDPKAVRCLSCAILVTAFGLAHVQDLKLRAIQMFTAFSACRAIKDKVAYAKKGRGLWWR
jgi:hypothetical protein